MTNTGRTIASTDRQTHVCLLTLPVFVISYTWLHLSLIERCGSMMHARLCKRPVLFQRIVLHERRVGHVRLTRGHSHILSPTRITLTYGVRACKV